MIVLDEHYDEFVEKLTAAFKDATVGDPREEGTQVGPMSSTSAREDLMELVDDAVSHGAQVRTGGHARAGAGANVTDLLDGKRRGAGTFCTPVT